MFRIIKYFNLGKNKNIQELYLKICVGIKPIENLEKLEIFNAEYSIISDISFLEKNNNIKELNLSGCVRIKDFKPIEN